MSHENPNYLSIDIPASGLSEPLVCHQENLLQILHYPTMERPGSPIDNSLLSNPKRARNALDAFMDVVENDILSDLIYKSLMLRMGDEAKNEVVKTILEDDEIYLANDDVIVS
ncbi:hypothetical protein V6N11_017587 [Hibiscus sabdariffa]|uniref:Uncharacterized protein n=1 Tax=Hibiscus sabdariffa TaxID=183260 RepID=A0ABR2TZ86_9ROSI